MSHLRLVKETPFSMIGDVIAELIDASPELYCYPRMYGTTGTRCNLWDFENAHNGQAFRVIYDPTMMHLGRQGIHHAAGPDFDMDRLVELINEAERDCFDTVWIH
jgi:hypothetical protein